MPKKREEELNDFDVMAVRTEQRLKDFSWEIRGDINDLGKTLDKATTEAREERIAQRACIKTVYEAQQKINVRHDKNIIQIKTTFSNITRVGKIILGLCIITGVGIGIWQAVA